MISKRMKPLVNDNSAIRAMFEEDKRLAATHDAENVYDLSLGNPSAPTPTKVNLTICDIPKEERSTSVHGYMSSTGYEDARQTVAESLNKRFDTRFHQNNILTIVEATGDLNVTLKTLLNLGDEVIAFAPYFVEYGNYVRNYDGNLVVISSDTAGFESNLAGLKQKINARTKVVIINTPNNPTGAVYSLETLTRVADIMQAKGKELGMTIMLLPDEPCGEPAYNDVEILYVTNVCDNTIICYSYNKSLSLPGEHIGYLVVPGALKDNGEVFNAAIIANRMLDCVNAPSLVQGVITRCLNAKMSLEAYDRNRNLLYNRLRDPGFGCIKSQGALYLSVKSPEIDEKKFCENCKKYDILMVPGTSFACPSYVRIFHCMSYEQIERSLPAFAEAAVDYGPKK